MAETSAHLYDHCHLEAKMVVAARQETHKTGSGADGTRQQTTDATTLIQHFLSEGKIREVLESQVRYFLFWKLLSTHTEEATKSSEDTALDFSRRWRAPLAPTSVEGVDAALLTRVVHLQEKEGKPTLFFKAFVSLVLDWLKAYGFVHAAGVLRPEASLRDSDLLTDEEQMFVLGLPRSLLPGSVMESNVSRQHLAPLLERAVTSITMIQPAGETYSHAVQMNRNLGKSSAESDSHLAFNVSPSRVGKINKTAGHNLRDEIAAEALGHGRDTSFCCRADSGLNHRPLSAKTCNGYRWEASSKRGRGTSIRVSSTPPSISSSRGEPLLPRSSYDKCGLYLDRTSCEYSNSCQHRRGECDKRCGPWSPGEGIGVQDDLLDAKLGNWFSSMFARRLESLEKEYSEKIQMIERVHTEAQQAREAELETARKTAEAAQQAEKCFIEMQQRQAQSEAKLELARKALEQRALELDIREKRLSEASTTGQVYVPAIDPIQESESKLNGRLQQLQAMLDQAHTKEAESQNTLQQTSHEREAITRSSFELLGAAAHFREKAVEQEARLARSQLETEELRAQLVRAQQSRLAAEAQLQRVGAYASSLTTEHEASLERIRQDLEQKYSVRMQEVETELQKALTELQDRDARFKLLVAELEGMRREKADAERSAARLKKLYGAAKAARVHQKRLASSVAKALTSLDLDPSPPASLCRGSTAYVEPSFVNHHHDASPSVVPRIDVLAKNQNSPKSSSQRISVTRNAATNPWSRSAFPGEPWDMHLQPSSFIENAVGIQKRVAGLMACFIKQAEQSSFPKGLEQSTRNVSDDTFKPSATGNNDISSNLNTTATRSAEVISDKLLSLNRLQSESTQWHGKCTDQSMEEVSYPTNSKCCEERTVISTGPAADTAVRRPVAYIPSSDAERTRPQRNFEGEMSISTSPTSGIPAPKMIPDTHPISSFANAETLSELRAQTGVLEQQLTPAPTHHSAAYGDRFVAASVFHPTQNNQPRQSASPPAVHHKESERTALAVSDPAANPLHVQEASNDAHIGPSTAAATCSIQKQISLPSNRTDVECGSPGNARKYLNGRETSQETVVPECSTLVSGTGVVTANLNYENAQKLGCNNVLQRAKVSTAAESDEEKCDSGQNVMRQISLRKKSNALDMDDSPTLPVQRGKLQASPQPTTCSPVTKARCIDFKDSSIRENSNGVHPQHPSASIQKHGKDKGETKATGKPSQVYAVSSHSPASGARLLLNADIVPVLGVDNEHESLTPAEAAASSRIATSPWEDASLASSLPHSPAVLSGFPSLLCPVAPACETPSDESSSSHNVLSSLEAGEVGCYLPLPSRRWSSTQEVNLAALSDNESFPSLSPPSTSARNTSG